MRVTWIAGKYSGLFYALGLFHLLALNLPAATTVFDFERDDEIALWKCSPPKVADLKTCMLFATSGKYSLRFSTPAWKNGMAEWPAFEARPPVVDWSPYDRLVVDITNPHTERFSFGMFVSDSKVPFRKGLYYPFQLPSKGWGRFVIPLSKFPKEVNRGDIAILHFFTTRPATNLTLYLDNIVLLRPGETLPEPGENFVYQLANLSLKHLGAVEQHLAKVRQENPTLAGLPFLLAPLEARLKSLDKEGKPGLTMKRLNEINAELTSCPAQIERLVSIARFQKACREEGQTQDNILVGLASSMEKILPREVPVSLRPARAVAISLARNEKESFQVAVLPLQSPLRKVVVSASDLKSSQGEIFPHERIQCEVVGYVRTEQRPPYNASHVGWWPDPILNFLGSVDIATGDLQTFWIRVCAPRNQAPGLYRGKLSIQAANAPAFTMDLAVQVRKFALEDSSPLPLAITFAPHDWPNEESKKEQEAWRKTEQYPLNAWKKHKLRWADFLADYFITYDSLYHHEMPDFDLLMHLHKQGRLGRFNLGYYGEADRRDKDGEKWKAKNLPRFRAAYAKARELGILDHAYLYGCDEVTADLFPEVQQVAAILKAEFPDVLILTTTTDRSYGLQSVIRSVDGFCPLTPSFDPVKAAKARTAKKEVWWYICCGPHHPHANMFIEYPAIEGRLLMGAMTAKQRPDGFLYYQISIWNSRVPINSGPFTDWNPRSWTTYHGDGSWTCVGPDGTPLPTIRLENFRDGLEDYAYVLLLEKMVRDVETHANSLSPEQQRWLKEAREALEVPITLVKSMTDYSRDPAQVYSWRNRLAELIDRGSK